ncbi:DUF349 domain-containing protein [Schaalia sp. ZJ405]|uniref:DUF349 domain-containing protein n=1 Tax=Schaalia sp. ZJ405 TaxID=2709403 RepID=UPI0013EA681C|nr:DUF349 domain-containing protein [Schaalia sp. ZJ405]QPK80516.1 DUF349 domain-containing protein [Schaalia sp. ZJ405]
MTTTPIPQPTGSQTETSGTNATEQAQASASQSVPAPQSLETPATISFADVPSHPFGRIGEDGTVYVTDGDSERVIGGYPEGIPADPYALYERRFADLEASIKLFEDRLAQLGPKDIDSTLKSLREQVKEPNAIGDLAALRARVDAVAERAQERKEQARVERQEAREAALRARTDVVERAEAIVAQDPEKTHWKQSGQNLRDLLDEWKGLQRKGPRLDKATEDELWKRFSGARTQFDRRRRQFFSALDQSQAEAKRIKEDLIAQAEALQTSTDWAGTSTAYRDLMAKWKTAPRASRKEDDALWARFRSAQQVFFDARRAKDEATDTEYRENLVAKEALLDEAEKILPINNLDQAKKALRSIQDRWDEIGRVPSADLHRIDARLRAVESAVREAEEKEWRRTNPETRARAEGMLGQLEDQVASLEADLARAQEEGDSAKASSISEALSTKMAWLNQIRSSME